MLAARPRIGLKSNSKTVLCFHDLLYHLYCISLYTSTTPCLPWSECSIQLHELAFYGLGGEYNGKMRPSQGRSLQCLCNLEPSLHLQGSSSLQGVGIQGSKNTKLSKGHVMNTSSAIHCYYLLTCWSDAVLRLRRPRF